MRKSRVLLGLVVSALFLTAPVLAGEETNLKGVKCVLNPKGNAKASCAAQYKRATVYFCCDDCKGKFTADSKKYAAAANAQLVATKQAKQVNCPLMGKPVKEKIVTEVAGIKVHLCCPGCQKKIAKANEPDQLELVFGEKAFAKGFKVVKKDKK